jgi:septal ring factor EnvC (AmiA/AmiB activator)
MNWDKIKDVLTICLIPAVGWALLTSRDVGQLEARLEQQVSEVMEAQAEIKALQKRTQMIEVSQAKIETKLEVLGAQLTRIESMLNSTFATIK